MVFDASFFVALSFVLFVILTYKPISKVVITALDERAARIKNELGEALRLKEEAQALLASYQRKQREVAEEAESIVAEAQKEAKRLAVEAETELEASLNKRVELAMQKIAAYEAAVIQQVKSNSVDIAISTVRSLVVENLSNDAGDEIIGKAISDMGKKLH